MNLSPERHALTALIMSVVIFVTSLPLGVASAGMVSSRAVIEQEQADAKQAASGEAERDRIRDLLARDDVRAEMVALGIEPAEAEARLAALTDQEVATIAGRLDELPAGEGIGGVLVLLFIVFGVAVLLDAIGIINIFPFVCGPGECGGRAQAYYPEPAAGPDQAYRYEEPPSAYRYERDQFGRSDRRRDRIYEQEIDPYYQAPPPEQPSTRNYYEERFGAQRYVR